MDDLAELVAFLTRVPAIQPEIRQGRFDNGNWWVKFGLDISLWKSDCRRCSYPCRRRRT